MEQLFTDQTFEKKDLSGNQLQKGEYENCIFKSCDFSGGDFSDILFIDCTFTGCNLSVVKLIKTVFRDVVFKDCKMLGLNFENCSEFGLSLSFEGCSLNQSSFYRTKQKKTSFKNVQLQEVDLTECDLTDAVFEGCDFTAATFESTILEKADLRTSFNYAIDPEKNRIKKARFSLSGIPGLLGKYDIKIFPAALLVCVLLLLSRCSYAQKPGEPRPGVVLKEDFAVAAPVISATDAAVVLADIGVTTLEYSNTGWRKSLKHTKRIKILNNSGLDRGSVSIQYSADANRDGKLKDLSAYTYNLKNGEVEAIPVNAKDMFLLRSKNSDLLEERFTFPGMQVGSIIEFSYTVKSSTIESLFPWQFQNSYPTLWSEYTVVVPDLFNYAVTTIGNQPFYKTSVDSMTKEMSLRAGNEDHMIYTKKWIMKDVPRIKEEPFVYCHDSYAAAIHFQASIFPVYGFTRMSVLPDWQGFASDLLDNPRFGQSISDEMTWLGSRVDTITSGCTTALAKAKKIYSFLQDGFECTGEEVLLYSDLPEVLSGKQGNVAEINLLLVAMLRKKNIPADPVILSTRENGLTSAVYPLVDNLNYVVARAEIDGRTVYLDASNKNLGFGRLPVSCYNGHARVITRDCYPVFFQPDSLQEAKMTTLFITNNEKEGQTVRCIHNAGYYESMEIRPSLASGKEQAYFRSLISSLPIPAELHTFSSEGLAEKEQPVTIQYEAGLNLGNDSLIYFNPMMEQGLGRNPFPPGGRLYPVELPYASNATVVLDMEIPAGYTIEEMPKSAKVNFNDTEASFEYMIGKMGDHIQIRRRLIIRKTHFAPDGYEDLRNFFEFVLKKENEMIVFKKII